jgi:hypothetical protein
MLELLFLDNDHVMNRIGDRHANGYFPLHIRHVELLNTLLESRPNLRIVVSSAWRYHVHNGEMTLAGLEALYMTHGVNCKGRIHGITEPDPETFDPAHHTAPFDAAYWEARGLKWRPMQIQQYLTLNCAMDDGTQALKRLPLAYVAVDDLPLEGLGGHFVQTTKEDGLTWTLLDKIDNVLLRQVDGSKSRADMPAQDLGEPMPMTGTVRIEGSPEPLYVGRLAPPVRWVGDYAFAGDLCVGLIIDDKMGTSSSLNAYPLGIACGLHPRVATPENRAFFIRAIEDNWQKSWESIHAQKDVT